jgi:hypothetical protein
MGPLRNLGATAGPAPVIGAGGKNSGGRHLPDGAKNTEGTGTGAA